jgi:hypothetical protein
MDVDRDGSRAKNGEGPKQRKKKWRGTGIKKEKYSLIFFFFLELGGGTMATTGPPPPPQIRHWT